MPPVPDHADSRPFDPFLTQGQTDGSAYPKNLDVREGVQAWLSAHGAAPPAAAPAASRAGRPLPEDKNALGPEADAEAVARKILLDQLTGQARSRAELATKLAKKQVPDEVAERLLTRFEEVGLIDDEAFARSWVQSRQAGKGLARRALAHELHRKGIADEVARAALEEVHPDDEVDSARVLVQRKMRSLKKVDRNTAIRRLTGMLARKGYPPGVATRVVREELEAAGQDAGDVIGELD